MSNKVLFATYDAARKKSRDWELSVRTRFNKTDQLSIMSMLAYFDNIERGFSRHNDEEFYIAQRTCDTSGQLYEEAVCGFEYSKKLIHLGPLVWKIKACRKIRKKKKL